MVSATIKTCLCGDSITYIYEALLGGGGGMHFPRLNFKSCHVAVSEGPYVAVRSKFRPLPRQK